MGSAAQVVGCAAPKRVAIFVVSGYAQRREGKLMQHDEAW